MSTPPAQHKQEMAVSALRKKGHDLTRVLDHEKEILVRADEEKRFSRALTNFLEQQCIRGADVSITDKQLFRHFRAFWMQAPECFDHPALLGQFRVALAQRGFLTASTGKHPRWLGLTLRNPDKQKVQKRGEQPPHA